MDQLSFLVFFLYTMMVLLILVYISPVVSVLLMIIIPAGSVYLLPEQAVQFLVMEQFSFMDVPIYNIHILLMVWSGLIGIAVYSELLSWYLLLDSPSVSQKKVAPAPDEPPKSPKDKIQDFLLRLGKIMSGGK
ncbi:MAG: hypothetical protein OIN88_01545 [Candidatus Methanoperedens sp.]|nr:hypothetical protein [Candidatus Methanoperedens sp.]MCZ7359745.1 hypothetical protein [Candidatus Methanoperedens sp.]HLB70410.1 hypothetical protein [Candidatus Methanoperedens sp.]